MMHGLANLKHTGLHVKTNFDGNASLGIERMLHLRAIFVCTHRVYVRSGCDIVERGLTTRLCASHLVYTEEFWDILSKLTVKGESEGQAVPVRTIKSCEEDYGIASLLTSALEVVDNLHAPTFLPAVYFTQGHTSCLESNIIPIARTYLSTLKAMYPLKVHHVYSIS
jgi:hypothetical protein